MIQSRLTRSEVTKHGTHKEGKTNKHECTHDMIKRMKSKSLNSARNRQERLPTNLKRRICEVENKFFKWRVQHSKHLDIWMFSKISATDFLPIIQSLIGCPIFIGRRRWPGGTRFNKCTWFTASLQAILAMSIRWARADFMHPFKLVALPWHDTAAICLVQPPESRTSTDWDEIRCFLQLVRWCRCLRPIGIHWKGLLLFFRLYLIHDWPNSTKCGSVSPCLEDSVRNQFGLMVLSSDLQVLSKLFHQLTLVVGRSTFA